MAADLGPNAMPDRIAIDAHGYGWRVWNDQEYWSMVPQNPDNDPIPRPLTWFVREPQCDLAADVDAVGALARALVACGYGTVSPDLDASSVLSELIDRGWVMRKFGGPGDS